MLLNQKMNEENVVHLYNGVLYAVKKKNNDILKFEGNWMDLEKTILSEVTHTKKDKYAYSLISGF